MAKIILPPELQDPVDGEQVWSDRAAVYQAVAILFPWATRELLMRTFQEGKLTIEDIATMLDLPSRYVRLVMSDLWKEQYEAVRSYPRGAV